MSELAIVANGPFLPEMIIREAVHHRLLMALDGAAEKLIKLDLHPSLILGDMDSLSQQAKAYFIQQGTQIVVATNQDLTDMVKAIRYSDEKLMATDITLLCATAGRLDHHENIIRSLRTEYKRERPITLHTEQQTLRFAKDETIHFKGEIGDKCGVIAFPAASATSKGLVYELNDMSLTFGYADSTCNILRDSAVSVTIKGEALIIMPPQLAAQRSFMQLSEVARQEALLQEAIRYARPIP